MLRTYNGKSIDVLRHRQNNAIWSLIALAIGEKIAKAVLPRVRCNNSTVLQIFKFATTIDLPECLTAIKLSRSPTASAVA